MVEGIAELKRICQEPVNQWQDLSGRLYGSRLSIYFTRLFLGFGVSPSTVTLIMALCGVLGAILLIFQGVLPIIGIILLILHYVLDCCDGEIARYLEKQDIQWTFYDYLIHYAVKSMTFLCLGLGAHLRSPKGWIFLFSVSAVLFLIMEKVVRELYYAIYCKKVRGFVSPFSEKNLSCLSAKIDAARSEKEPAKNKPSRYHRILSFLRIALLTFELYTFLFLAGAFIDLFIFPGALPGVGLNCKEILLILYGILLPLHFADFLQSYIRKDGLYRDIARLQSKIHHP